MPSCAYLRQRLFVILEQPRLGWESWLSSGVLGTLIVLNILAVILESEVELYAEYEPYFRLFESISVAIFTMEYLTRVWISVEHSNLKGTAVTKRLKYILSPMALVDLIAILPFYLSTWLGIDLRILRSIRLLRLLKLPAIRAR